MNAKKVTGNPTMALASLIRPEQDRLIAMRAMDHDSFVLLEGRPMITRSPLIHNQYSHFKTVFDLIMADAGNAAERLSTVLLSDARTGVHFEEAWKDRSEADVITAYGNYVSSIGCPARFARSWNDFISLMLRTVATIVVGIEALLAARGGIDIDAGITRQADLSMIDTLAPHVTALRKFFDASVSFGRNELVVNRWEEAFSRGQRHLLGNALSPITYINRFADAGVLTYRNLVDALEEIYKIFDPIAHIRESYSADIVGRWLRIEMMNEKADLIRPERGVALRRVIDEIIYKAGTTGEDTPQGIEVEWIEGEKSLLIRTHGDAFSAFGEGMPARRFVTRTYGGERMRFVKGRGQRISEIGIAVMDRMDIPGSGTADGGDSSIPILGSSNTQLAGARAYTTGAVAGYATVFAAQARVASSFCL